MSAPMTREQIDAIEARTNAATMEPWHAHDHEVWADWQDIGSCRKVAGYLDKTDAEFIAHARTDVPALIAAARYGLDMEAEIERLRAVARHMRDGHPDACYPECEGEGP